MTTTSLEHGKDRGASLQQQRARAAFWFLAPMLVALFCVAAWPLLRTIYFSFTNTSLDNLYGGHLIGFGNYLRWRTMPSGAVRYYGTLVDPDWWNAVWNTVRFAIVSVSFETVLGMIVALVLNAEFKGRGLVRAAILIPWAIPTIVSAKMWAWMLNDQYGIINDLAVKLHLLDHKLAWTASTDTAMIAVLIVDIWKTTPFMALLCLAGLQMIPRDIYEATKIDGINPIRVFFKVTLPLVRPALMVAVIFRMLDALRIFDLVYVLTPNSSATKTMSVISRENMFDFAHFAYGAAQSTLLFTMLAIFVLLFVWIGKVDLTGETNR
ncbi:MAG: ABC transporter permease subunit [Limimaricola sp.]|uniref:carbohydrate ABC transporter permease n=1 Tax=Limimaricola sp. TaxID=2211665 RepID=UPI001D2D03EA|nr:sugar ABC transporter permease [Limimaricola sp.]MBI1416394.1 ABC transporter permease subunit [Limimaricola sp.]